MHGNLARRCFQLQFGSPHLQIVLAGRGHPCLDSQRIRGSQRDVFAQRRNLIGTGPDDFGQQKLRILERALGVNDTLLRSVVERLSLFDVAARADAGLFAGLGLVEQIAERLARRPIGGELVTGRQNAEVGLRNSQQQLLFSPQKARLSAGGLQVCFLQALVGFEAPQRLR